MFSPPEHFGFDLVRNYFSDWAYRVYLAHLFESVDADPTEVFEDEDPEDRLFTFRVAAFSEDVPMHQVPREHERWALFSEEHGRDQFQVALIYHCMMAKVIMQLDTLLSSPDGKTVRPDEYLFVHMDRLDWIHPRWPIPENSELKRMFELFESRRLGGEDLAERYCFFDHSLGVIRFKNNSVSAFAKASHFVSDDYSRKYIETQVEPFKGWSVVWSEKDFPEDIPRFLESIGALEERWGLPALLREQSNDAKPTKKRGPKYGPARDLFQKKYPQGLPTELSAEAVAAEFAAQGISISPRQINNYDRETRCRK